MSPTLFASFKDPAMAERAAGALLDHGVRPEDISLVAHASYEARRDSPDGGPVYESAPTIMSGNDGIRTQDPLSNSIRDTPNAKIQNVDAFNPALDDYPAGAGGIRELTSAPPESPRDFNEGIENDDYNRHYEAETDRELGPPRMATSMPGMGEAGNRTMKGPVDPNVAPNAYDQESTGPKPYDPEAAAKHGITTTTGKDAASGSIVGAEIGLGVGAAATLAALIIPGFGLVMGGGALAAALAGVAASAGAGAIAGGVAGYLKDQGVPEDSIPQFMGSYEEGGAILGVTLHEGGPARDRIERILAKYEASTVGAYRAYMS